MIVIAYILLLFLHYFQVSTSFPFIRPLQLRRTEGYRYEATNLLSRSKKDDDNDVRDSSFHQRSKSWIVLVDDEESIRLAVGNYLFDSGYVVTACADADALLELLTSASTGNVENMPTKLPSVIICDIRMPGRMNGLELLDLLKNPSSRQIISGSSDVEFVRSQWRRIPVILLSAKSLTQDRIDGYKKGADVYLPKPFDPAELLSIVDNLIRRMKALGGGDDGKTLRGVKADIISIKAILKSETKNSRNGDNDEEKQQKMLSPRSTYSQGESSAIVPSKQTAKKYSIYQSELDELSSRVKLTDVEIEVLALLCEGMTNGDIAEKMGFSAVKVGRIISKMYSQTFMKTRTELVRWAIKMGYVSAR